MQLLTSAFRFFFLVSVLMVWLSAFAVAENVVQAVNQGKAEVSLIGDGKTTIKTKLLFKNLTAESLILEMPENTVFECEARQSVMVLQEKTITLGPKASAQSTVHTMCLGKPTDQPALESPTNYNPRSESTDGKRAAKILKTCEALEKGGRFPALPLPPALVVRIISQLAYWHDSGSLTEDEIRDQAMVQMGLDEESATPEQKEEVNQGVENIFEAIDLTQKTSKETS